MKYYHGEGTMMGKDHTIMALIEGRVTFKTFTKWNNKKKTMISVKSFSKSDLKRREKSQERRGARAIMWSEYRHIKKSSKFNLRQEAKRKKNDIFRNQLLGNTYENAVRGHVQTV